MGTVVDSLVEDERGRSILSLEGDSSWLLSGKFSVNLS